MPRNEQLISNLRYVGGLMHEFAQLAKEVSALSPRPLEREEPEQALAKPALLAEELGETLAVLDQQRAAFDRICDENARRGGYRQEFVFSRDYPSLARLDNEEKMRDWNRRCEFWRRTTLPQIRARNEGVRERNRQIVALNEDNRHRCAALEMRMEQLAERFAQANATGWYPPRFCTAEACDWLIDAAENQLVHDDSELAAAYLDHLRWTQLLEGQQRQYELTRQAIDELRRGQERTAHQLDAMREELRQGNLALADQVRTAGLSIVSNLWLNSMFSSAATFSAADSVTGTINNARGISS